MYLNFFALLVIIYGWAGVPAALCRFRTMPVSLCLSEHALVRLIPNHFVGGERDRISFYIIVGNSSRRGRVSTAYTREKYLLFLFG